MSSYSVCNHTRDKQIGLPLRGRPICLITRMITDRIGLYLVLLPLIIIKLSLISKLILSLENLDGYYFRNEYYLSYLVFI